MAIKVAQIGTGNVGRHALTQLINDPRFEVTGEPSYALDLCLRSPNGDHNHAGLVATAARVVNAIPAVVAAPPGISTTLDLPLITGKGLYAG